MKKAYEVEYQELKPIVDNGGKVDTKVELDDSHIKRFIKEIENQRDKTENWSPAPLSEELEQPRRSKLKPIDWLFIGVVIGIGLTNIAWWFIFNNIVISL